MNFCKLYNRTMKLLEGDEHEPKKSINIVFGLFEIFIGFVLLILKYGIYNPLKKSVGIFVRKIDSDKLYSVLFCSVIIIYITFFLWTGIISIVVSGNKLVIAIFIPILLVCLYFMNMSLISIIIEKIYGYEIGIKFLYKYVANPCRFIYNKLLIKLIELTTSKCNLEDK